MLSEDCHCRPYECNCIDAVMFRSRRFRDLDSPLDDLDEFQCHGRPDNLKSFYPAGVLSSKPRDSASRWTRHLQSTVDCAADQSSGQQLGG